MKQNVSEIFCFGHFYRCSMISLTSDFFFFFSNSNKQTHLPSLSYFHKNNLNPQQLTENYFLWMQKVEICVAGEFKVRPLKFLLALLKNFQSGAPSKKFAWDPKIQQKNTSERLETKCLSNFHLGGPYRFILFNFWVINV